MFSYRDRRLFVPRASLPVIQTWFPREGVAVLLGVALAVIVLSSRTRDEGAVARSPMPWRFTSFPIVAWWGPPGTASREDFEAYRDAGFTLHATNPDEGFVRALDYVEAVGLHSLVFRQHQGFALTPLAHVTFPENRDSVVGWITADEPHTTEQIARAIETVHTLMRADPGRWAFFNMLSPATQGQPSTEAIADLAVAAGMPVLSYDTYAIMVRGRDRADDLYEDLSRMRVASRRLGVPFWAFALTIAHGGYRRPSESDLRWQVYSNLAYGAKGLWYFTYWGPTDWRGWDTRAIVDPRDGSRTDLYGWVQTVNRAVLDVGTVLLGLDSVDVVHTRPSRDQRAFTAGRSWITGIRASDALLGTFSSPDGTPYAMLVNKLHGQGKSARDAADTIELEFSTDVAAVESVSWLDGTPGPLAIQARRASLTVAGGTGVLLKARLAPAPPAGVDSQRMLEQSP